MTTKKQKNPTLVRLGESILIRRRRLGISQEELARRVGLYRTHVGGIERGEFNLSVLNLVNIAQALESTPSDVFKDAGL